MTAPKLPEGLEPEGYFTTTDDGRWVEAPEGADRSRLTPLYGEASLLAKEAECETLRAAIRDHNNDCESRCEQRQQDGDVHCPYAKYGRQCPDCPRDGMVDAAIDAARAAADQGGAS